jgi:hypothetical protein
MQKKKDRIILETHHPAQKDPEGNHSACIEREQTIADDL